MALYDILRSADDSNGSVAVRIANELERLFRFHQFEFRSDIDECIDDSGEWLVGTVESPELGVCLNLYVHDDGSRMKAYVETDTDHWWANGLTTFEDIADVIVDAVNHSEQEQRTLADL